jgi:hypothetical protein
VINSTLRLTPIHPVYVNGGWKPAGEIIVGDQLLGEDGSSQTVETMGRIRGRVRVFDLRAAQPHDFFADGYLVHNKSR